MGKEKAGWGMEEVIEVERIYNNTDKDTWEEGMDSIHYQYIRVDETDGEVKVGSTYDFHDKSTGITWYGGANEIIDNEIQIFIFT